MSSHESKDQKDHGASGKAGHAPAASSTHAAADPACPPGLTFNKDIKALFEPYRQCMLDDTGLDLGDYGQVKTNITAIKTRIDNNSMPRNDGSGTDYKAIWAKANGKFIFNCWFAQGFPEGAPSAAASTSKSAAAPSAAASTAQPTAHAAADPTCPPGITFTNTIKALFQPYQQCMLDDTGLDLGDYGQVKTNITAINTRINNNSMPRNDGSGTDYKAIWAKANGKFIFNCWFAQGFPE